MSDKPRAMTLEERFEEIHKYGVKRHAEVWFTANTKAVHVPISLGFDVSDPRMKLLVSTVVLRVLDVVNGGRK